MATRGCSWNPSATRRLPQVGGLRTERHALRHRRVAQCHINSGEGTDSPHLASDGGAGRALADRLGRKPDDKSALLAPGVIMPLFFDPPLGTSRKTPPEQQRLRHNGLNLP